MKIRYFIEKKKDEDQGMVWRMIDGKIEFVDIYTNSEHLMWRSSSLRSLKELEAPETSLKEIMPQELVLFF